MRTEQEMMKLILDTASQDERIRAVYMNGSRTNPQVPRDIFQDYDIVYVVKETESFQKDKSWIDRFGERLYMQSPEEMDRMLGQAQNVSNCYGWLMQFADGNRLDLHVQTIEYTSQEIKKDSLCKILLDKDAVLPAIPEASDASYFVKRPDEIRFLCTCNEFWWCLNNVAKGLWRKEVPYVQDILNFNIRPQLVEMLSWKIGNKTDYSCSIGKSGKYMYRWLEAEDWNAFLESYASGELEELWEAVIGMCRLFDKTAIEVGESLGFSYNRQEANASLEHLIYVRTLPETADEIYETK